jgi:hypothetical protein
MVNADLSIKSNAKTATIAWTYPLKNKNMPFDLWPPSNGQILCCVRHKKQSSAKHLRTISQTTQTNLL